jgi:S1-C subfamily serine protease
MPDADSLLMTAARVSTYDGQSLLTHASGFFFERSGRLYLVTSGHVVLDEPTGHHPSRLEIELHTDGANLTRSTGFSMLLFRDGRSVWRQGRDAAGEIDVAVIELDRTKLPAGTALSAFTPAHLMPAGERVEIGASLLIAGFPLGFHDALHHLPVVRQTVLASAWGLRFQGQGYFLTDARTHRGTSGAAVVMRMRTRDARSAAGLPWRLLGIHSSRVDMGNRELAVDEALGLNCAWYADILLTLTEPGRPAAKTAA